MQSSKVYNRGIAFLIGDFRNLPFSGSWLNSEQKQMGIEEQLNVRIQILQDLDKAQKLQKSFS